MSINWKRVTANLFCPQCGEKANISAESDGTEGYHTHYFPISREWAQQISDEARTPAEEIADLIGDLSEDEALKIIKEIKRRK